VARFWSDKQAIVTGGAGFLGQHVVATLQSEGCGNIFVPHHRDYDLTAEEAVERMFRDAAQSRTEGEQPVVLHLAGMNGGIGANKARPAEFFYQNIMMNVLTIHYAWKTGARKVVAAGAGSGYPLSAPQPLKEESLWAGYPQAETAPYALAKRMLDVQGSAYWNQYGLPVVTALLGNVYGPHDNFDPNTAPVISALVSKFVDAAERELPHVSPWGTGKSTRDFVYAGDVAEGLLLAAEKYQQAEVVNLSAGADTSIRQVVELIVALTNYTGDVTWDTTRPDGQTARRLDTSKAQRDLGWQARTNLGSGLKLTVDWYRAQVKANITLS
jgi:GDP-L-fucose synthase